MYKRCKFVNCNLNTVTFSTFLIALLSIAIDELSKIFSKISKNFLFLISNKIFVFRAGIQKMLVRKANREDPDQTASSEAV